ncbi:MAG: Holliday junction resolvase RuvX [Sedimenticolaceae bacterium]|nr:Holliday junction resolvase RuvX [Sedimenticolaceae bacterium]
MPETLLGFDYGTRRIGVAVGQSLTGTASPLTTLDSRNGRPDWEAITALIEEWKPVAFVVGYPVDTDGSENPIMEPVKKFARQLQGRYHLPVHFIDETLTSIEAARYTGPKFASGGRNDATAAAIILETWLNQ